MAPFWRKKKKPTRLSKEILLLSILPALNSKHPPLHCQWRDRNSKLKIKQPECNELSNVMHSKLVLSTEYLRIIWSIFSTYFVFYSPCKTKVTDPKPTVRLTLLWYWVVIGPWWQKYEATFDPWGKVLSFCTPEPQRPYQWQLQYKFNYAFEKLMLA